MQRWRPNHPHLTPQKSFYVEISRARDRAELVTDDAKTLREQLEAVTGERISALEGIGETKSEAHEREQEAVPAGERERERGAELGGDKDWGSATKLHEARVADRGRGKREVDPKICTMS